MCDRRLIQQYRGEILKEIQHAIEHVDQISNDPVASQENQDLLDFHLNRINALKIEFAERVLDIVPPLSKKKAKEQFDQLIDLTIADLESEELSSLNQETVPSIPELVEINKMGFLTVDSQQGQIFKTNKFPLDRPLYQKFWADAVKLRAFEGEELVEHVNKNYQQAGGKWTSGVDYKEKAYLSGYFDIDKAYDLIQILNSMSNIVALGRNNGDGVKLALTYQTVGPHQGNYSKYDQFPLIGFTGPRVNTNMPELGEIGSADIIENHEMDIDPAIAKFYMPIEIIDARFGHNVSENDGLFKRVLSALKTINQ